MNTTLAAVRRFEVTFAAQILQALKTLAARATATPVAPALRRHMVRNATLWIERPVGRSVRCEAGTLWLTFDGEPEDVILEAGQTHRCAHSSRLAIHALDRATVRVS